MSKTNKMADLLDEDEAVKLPEEELPIIDKAIPPMAVTNQPQKIPDHRGKRISQIEPLYASLGISKKFWPPLTRKRSAIYQLYNFKGKRDKRAVEPYDQIIDPYPFQMVPNYTFIDTGEVDLTRREKTMTYFEGGTEVVYITDPVSNKKIPQSTPKIGAPEFINGQVVVSIFNEFTKFVWWELHPRNASNKHRDMRKEPIFERIDTKYESPHVSLIKMDLRLDAERYVISLKPDGMMNLAAALTNPTINANINPQELRLVLRMRAQKNPEEILYRAPDETASVKVAAIHALDLGIIAFVPENESYYYGLEETPMCRIPVGNNPFEYLCSFLTGPDGQEEFERIKRDLSFWF